MLFLLILLTSEISYCSLARCLSSKELGTLAPPAGSPYAYMLFKKEQLELSMRQRLQSMRELGIEQNNQQSDENETTSSASSRLVGSNQMRNRRRAQHNQAVLDDLCSVVADLFIAESKLLKPLHYGVESDSAHALEREPILRSIHNFISALPTRYALGCDTPSEVLLHMRLMAAARSDPTKVAVHIHNRDGDDPWSRTASSEDRFLRLVTISCNDANGLLEYITRLLATGGSRVLDADVMLSTDGIVLVRACLQLRIYSLSSCGRQ
jgi:hypothetical protein